MSRRYLERYLAGMAVLALLAAGCSGPGLEGAQSQEAQSQDAQSADAQSFVEGNQSGDAQSFVEGDHSGATAVPGAETGGNRLADEQRRTNQWSQMNDRERAASVLMLHYPGADAAEIAQFLEQVQPAGVLLLGDTVPEPDAGLAQMTRLWQREANPPYLIGIDQEGGTVSRIPTDPSPGAWELQDAPVDATRTAFQKRAERLQELGVNLNFGVVADFTDDEDSFIYLRSLGTDAESAAQRVGAAVAGERDRVLTTLKHFPGHGAAPGDSHTTVPQADLSYEEWKSSVSLPFKSGIDAGADLVMTGHLRFPRVDSAPASLSKRWHSILREDLGFSGVIVTDDMAMLDGNEEYADPVSAAVTALRAGADLILRVGTIGDLDEQATAERLIDGILQAVEAGTLPQERLDEASLRVWKLRQSLS